MPYRELTSALEMVRGNPTSAMTWEQLKDKLRAHGVSGWGDELRDSASQSVSADPLAPWEKSSPPT